MACATPVVVETHAPMRDHALARVAVAPFTSDPGVDGAHGGQVEQGGPGIVVAQLVRAMEDSGRYQPIPPSEVKRALGGEERVDDALSVCRVAARELGADAVLFARVRRFVPRKGGERGVSRPASVWFEVYLRAPDGTLLWSGKYDETQQGLTDDLLSFRRNLSRGFRWVTADALAAYGARELVERMPGTP